MANDTSSLVMGTIYYDINFRKIVYKIKFPQAETWVISDTSVYRFVDSKQVSRVKTMSLPEFSIFHLALNGKLDHYGLDRDNPLFKMGGVERSGDMVLTTWMPDEKIKKVLGKVVMSNNNSQLSGIVFFAPDGKIAAKQFFQDYILVSGCEVPSKITKITYTKENEENYEITTFRNIFINNSDEVNMYNYNISP
ncbi:MAG: hypothetical protein HYY40_11620 [Bacteroidetes bacterium]|nr:hypothetical protein [Bacteroidota bacterium]